MIWAWTVFIAFVLLMLALDLGVFHRKAHVVKVREALLWSIMWITMGVIGVGLLVLIIAVAARTSGVTVIKE